MKYDVVYKNSFDNEKEIEVSCSKVLIREGAAIFVNSMGEVLKVFPLDKVISITLGD